MLTDDDKRILHEEAQDHVIRVHGVLVDALAEEEEKVERLRKTMVRAGSIDRLVEQKVLRMREDAVENMGVLLQSPYFVRCETRSLDTGELSTFYFSKQSFTLQRIYSWITPAATLRYEAIGPCSYKRPDGSRQRLELLRKDQFMIVQDRIKFMTSETQTYDRTLIYQEYFSTQKRDFALSDIVAQMEKAQDTVIRASGTGSMLISGPAGSGKTTLALHRLAYLAQSPETAELFPSKDMLVLVQDASSQEYFSNLLPELGIHNVAITTFEKWASGILDIKYNEPSKELRRDRINHDVFQFQKNSALKSLSLPAPRAKHHHASLEKIYAPFFDTESRKLFKAQIAEDSLDRFDLTILIKLRLMQDGELAAKSTYQTFTKNGRLMKHNRIRPIMYASMVIDEVQNYLPEQILCLKTCIDQRTKAILYIGDLAQQTKLCTIKDWSQVQEDFAEGRMVKLAKAYRNTKQIAEYIRTLGFDVKPQGLREGEPVKELMPEDTDGGREMLRKIFKKHAGQLIGVLCTDEWTLDRYRVGLADEFPDIHFMTSEEAQGVEFPIICLIMPQSPIKEIFAADPELRGEQEHIERDRLYVALTRAMDELFVVRTRR